MKKLLLALSAFLFLGLNSFGQCSPDMSHAGDPGIHPDSATGLQPAYVGTPYGQVITAVVPADTCVQIAPQPWPCSTLTFDSIVVVSVLGMPPGFAFTCNVPNCSFPGNSINCGIFTGTAAPGDEGTYPLTINLDAYVGGTGVPNSFVVDYYKIEVLPATAINEYDANVFEVANNKPNPFDATTQIQFTLGKASQVNFEVYNLIGQSVYSKKISAVKGKNTFDFDGSQLPAGSYIYKINDGTHSVSKKMIVSR